MCRRESIQSILIFGFVLAACHLRDHESSPADSSPPVDANANVIADAALIETSDAASPSDHAALPIDEASANDAAPVAPAIWGTARRFSAENGSFSVLYPRDVFMKANAKKDSIFLTSKIHETDGIQGTATYGMKFTRLQNASKPAAIKTVVDPQTFRDAFPDGTDKSFHASPNFLDAEKGVNGATGYRVTMGVEGIGEVTRVFSTRDGSTWRVDCNFCCGMIEPAPRITSTEQMDLCADVVHIFQSEH